MEKLNMNIPPLCRPSATDSKRKAPHTRVDSYVNVIVRLKANELMDAKVRVHI